MESPAGKPTRSPIAVVWLAPLLAVGMMAVLAYDVKGLFLFALVPIAIVVGLWLLIRWGTTAERDD